MMLNRYSFLLLTGLFLAYFCETSGQVLAPSEIYQVMQAGLRHAPQPLDIGNLTIRSLFEQVVQAKEKVQDKKAIVCLGHIGAILGGAVTMQKWALKYLDAEPVKPSGVLSLNIRWMGDFYQCRNIPTVNMSKLFSISPHYCRIDLMSKTTTTAPGNAFLMPSGLFLGVCLPKSCEMQELIALLNPILAKIGMKMNEDVSACITDDVPYNNPQSIAALTIFGVIGLLLLIGLTFDVGIRLIVWQKARRQWLDETSTDCAKAVEVKASDTTAKRPGKFLRLVLCFSPYSNFVKLLSVQTPREPAKLPNFQAINAIRTLSMFWIVLSHIGLICMLADNMTQIFEMTKRISFMFLYAGFYAVDTFFFLSGLLAYFSMAKQLKPKSVGGFFASVPFIYFHRYVRITIPVCAIMLIQVGLWAHFTSGPLYYQGLDYNCATNWWTNLLYVNNVVDMKHGCVSWVWYLAVDMQLFVFTPFVVYLFVKQERHGWAAIASALLLQLAFAFSLTYAYNLPSSLMAPMEQMMSQNTSQPNREYEKYFEIIYVTPYTRLGPYVVGVGCAHIIAEHGLKLSRKIFSKLWLSTLMWGLMFGIMLTLTYAQYDVYAGNVTEPLWASGIMTAFARPVWGLALSWLVFACAFNCAGPIGDILCWPVWAIPARLSYAAYLLHPMVYVFYSSTAQRAINITDVSLIFYFCATLFVTLLLSIVFSVAFESPVIGLQRLLIPSKSKK